MKFKKKNIYFSTHHVMEVVYNKLHFQLTKGHQSSTSPVAGHFESGVAVPSCADWGAAKL